jgi:UDP-glucose 4-epimerase
MVRLLDTAGHRVVVLDDLSTGFAQAVTAGQLVVGAMNDRALVEKTLRDHQIGAVMHFAACALVGESVSEPEKYYANNVVATLQLLAAMRATGVQRLVFSSTCATYGTPQNVPITEDEPQAPINPYGFTKLVVEQALRDYSRAYGLGYASLRYFNAAGASPRGDIGEHHDPESHLIPIVLQVALGLRPSVTIYGDDYPTPDGTCIRDYIHVDDLGSAHLAALERLKEGTGIEANLGTGQGHSVRQIIDACRQVTGRSISATVGPRRDGDPPQLVADARRARRLLDWQPKYTDINEIVATAWRWHQHHPHGYGARP